MIDYTGANLTLDAKARWRILTQECAGWTFIPNQPQFELIQAVGNWQKAGKIIFLMTSANGAGKTTTWANILGNIFWPGLNLYDSVRDCQTDKQFKGFFDCPLYRHWPERWPKLFWIIGHQKKMTGLAEKIAMWWPEGRYRAMKAGYEYPSRYEIDTGFAVQTLTTDMEWRAFEGDDVGFVICDEPPKKWQYDAAIQRTRMGGLVLIAATAIFEAGWFLDSVVDEAQVKGSPKYHQTVHVDMNSIDQGGEWDLGEYGIQKKGNLERDRIELMKKECPADLYPARIEGKLTILSGLVFKNYDRTKHFTNPLRWIYERRWYMYRMVIDDALRRPPFIAWTRLDRWGKRYVLREWPSVHDPDYGGKMFHDIDDRHPLTIYEICMRCIEIEEEFKIPRDRMLRLFDPNFALQPHPNRTGSTMVQHWIEESARAYAKKGYPKGTSFSFALNIEDELEGGLEAVRTLLTPTADGQLMFELNPEWCHNIDYAFRRFKYKEQPQDQKEWRGLWDKLEQIHKDPMDVVRYDAVFPFTYMPVPGMSEVSQVSGDYVRSPGSLVDSKGRVVPKKPVGVA